MIAQEIVQARLDDGQFAGRKPRDQRRIPIDRAGDEALARGRDRRAQPEMGHPHITDDRRAHAVASHVAAAADRRPSTR